MDGFLLTEKSQGVLNKAPCGGYQTLKGLCAVLCLEGLLVGSLCGENKQRNNREAKRVYVFLNLFSSRAAELTTQ